MHLVAKFAKIFVNKSKKFRRQILVFSVMAETVPSYAAKMAKVEAASGVSMEVMIYIVGPSAALQNSCSTPPLSRGKWSKTEKSGPDSSSSRSQRGKRS